MIPVLRLARPLNLVVAAAGTVVGITLASQSPPLLSVLYGLASVGLIMAGGNTLNDWVDREEDRTNHPDRPLPQGTISPRNALGLALVELIAGLPFAFAINYAAGLIATEAALVLVGYSLWLKQRGLIGNVAISFLVALTFVYGGVIAGDPGATLGLASAAFFANIARELTKDIEDQPGDREAGLRTVPLQYGERVARYLAGTTTLAAVGTLGAAAYSAPLLLVGLAPGMGMVAYGYALLVRKQVRTASAVYKYAMMLIILTFLIKGVVP